MKYPRIYLALDNCFAIKRWVEPKLWLKITKELGFNYSEASFDNEIDGLFSPADYMDDWFASIDKLGKEYGVKVANFFTGYQTYRTAGLTHPDERMVRHLLDQWLKPMIKRMKKAESGMGFYFHAIPDNVLQDTALYLETYHRLIERLGELTAYADELGGVNLCVEQMYAPHQPPWTIQGTMDLLRDCYRYNQKPLYTTVDVGHVIGQRKFVRPTMGQILESLEKANQKMLRPSIWLGADETRSIWFDAVKTGRNRTETALDIVDSINKFPYMFSFDPRDQNPYAWLEKLACYSPIIHMQQTDGITAPHAAFTSETNRKGIIRGPELLRAIAVSYETEAEADMPPKVDDLYLNFEIFGSNTEYKYDIIDKLQETAEYWRQFVPEDGIPLDKLLERIK
ncbi:MAG: TIM barrel protein [Eubacteriales bacterium]